MYRNIQHFFHLVHVPANNSCPPGNCQNLHIYKCIVNIDFGEAVIRVDCQTWFWKKCGGNVHVLCVSHSAESKRNKNNIIYAVIGGNCIFIIFGHLMFCIFVKNWLCMTPDSSVFYVHQYMHTVEFHVIHKFQPSYMFQQ